MNNPEHVGLWTVEVLVSFVVVINRSFIIFFKHIYIYLYNYICMYYYWCLVLCLCRTCSLSAYSVNINLKGTRRRHIFSCWLTNNMSRTQYINDIYIYIYIYRQQILLSRLQLFIINRCQVKRYSKLSQTRHLNIL